VRISGFVWWSVSLMSELTDAIRFLGEQAAALNTKPDDTRVWADLAHVLMNVKEFIFVK